MINYIEHDPSTFYYVHFDRSTRYHFRFDFRVVSVSPALPNGLSSIASTQAIIAGITRYGR